MISVSKRTRGGREGVVQVVSCLEIMCGGNVLVLRFCVRSTYSWLSLCVIVDGPFLTGVYGVRQDVVSGDRPGRT